MRLREGDIVIQRDWHRDWPTNLGLGKVVEAVPYAQVRVRWQGGRLEYEHIGHVRRVPPLVALAMQARD